MPKFSEILDPYGRPTALQPRANSVREPGGYQAAGWSRDRRVHFGSPRDSSADISHFTRNRLDHLARLMVKNVGLGKGGQIDFVKYVIGPGIFPFANTGDDAIDEAYDDWFWEFADICDTTRRMSFWDMQRAAEANRFVSGDVFTILTETPNGFPQFKLVRAHSCQSDQEDGYHDGVKLNRNNAPDRFKFMTKSGEFRSLPARSVDHSMVMEMGDEVRQVSALHSALLHLQDSLEIVGFEKLAVKDHSRISRVLQLQDPGDFSDSADPTHLTDDDAEVQRVINDDGRPAIPLEEVFGAEIHRLNIGEEMKSFASERPSPAFTGFLEFLGREIYSSTGWRYEFSWNPQGVTGPGARQILDSVARTAALRQATEIRRTKRLRNYAVAKAIEMGELPAHDRWYRCDYIAGAGEPTIDKGRDGKLEIAQIEAGLLSRKEYHGRRGQHYRKVAKQILKEAADVDLKAALRPANETSEEPSE